MRIVFERHAADEAAQHHGAPLAVIDAHLHKKTAAFIRQVVEIYGALVLPTLGQVGAVPEPLVQLHDEGEEAEGVKAHGLLGVKK
jgi:hypothetical protein